MNFIPLFEFGAALNCIGGRSYHAYRGFVSRTAWMNISKHFGRTLGGRTIPDSTAFCLTALAHAHVALVMGSAFGTEGYARLSFATDLKTLERGFDALASFLQG